MSIDSQTKTWIRNRSDELAVENGCRFNAERGQHVIDFAEKYLRLYEGEAAGEPMTYRDWQVEVTMRLFGWERWSERWGRWIRRFTRASVWVPKKNKKSPTLASWGLYLLCADGEQGQKVFFGAKDSIQAREIAGKHAVEMVLASNELSAECDINKTVMQITHLPTRSILKPISSGDSRTQKAKEGLNGSVLIDETHVVDREFINRVSRAGISRSEPLHIEVSTAGDDPECYGKEQYDYGKRVERGDVTDERYLFVSYEAPQDLTDEQLGADPAKYGKMANPAWGHTVHQEEFLDDYNRSAVSIPTLADFKKYRLNIWQRSANPWLRPGDWDKCATAFTEADLAGRTCYAGLDLSKTRDLTATAYCFPMDDDVYRLIVDFFLPERTAKDLANKVPYLQWATAGWITLTPGETVDYRIVRAKFRQRVKQFDVRQLVYDPWQAEETTQKMQEGDWTDGKQIEEGTYVERVLFKQSLVNYAGPCEEFEKLVIDGKLHHNNNQVLNWQAGHVTVKTDVSGNKRPVKPPRGDHKTIDGIVAGIMALAQCIQDYRGEPCLTVL